MSGTYYSSTPLVAKWISAVLDYEDSPDKHELVMVHSKWWFARSVPLTIARP